jgi:hypothetical protein
MIDYDRLYGRRRNRSINKAKGVFMEEVFIEGNTGLWGCLFQGLGGKIL